MNDPWHQDRPYWWQTLEQPSSNGGLLGNFANRNQRGGGLLGNLGSRSEGSGGLLGNLFTRYVVDNISRIGSPYMLDILVGLISHKVK